MTAAAVTALVLLTTAQLGCAVAWWPWTTREAERLVVLQLLVLVCAAVATLALGFGTDAPRLVFALLLGFMLAGVACLAGLLRLVLR